MLKRRLCIHSDYRKFSIFVLGKVVIFYQPNDFKIYGAGRRPGFKADKRLTWIGYEPYPDQHKCTINFDPFVRREKSFLVFIYLIHLTASCLKNFFRPKIHIFYEVFTRCGLPSIVYG